MQPKSCTAETLRCRLGKMLTRETPECCKDHIRRICFAFADLAQEHDLAWWMDYGMLLGAVRNQGIIPHDKDADAGFFSEDWPTVVRIGKALTAQGFHVIRKTPRNHTFRAGDSLKVRVSSINHINLDLFPWHPVDGDYHRKNYCAIDRYKGREFPTDKLLPLSEVEWEGRIMPAPADPEWFCEHRYGPGWRKPLYMNNPGKRVPDGYKVEA
jgi:phosphorylcholine metabolism protein LicD